jgi:hypothetical protein
VAPVHSVHQRITPEVVVERLSLNETGEILTERQETICHVGHKSESDGPERSDPRPTGRGTEGESDPAVGQTQQRDEEACCGGVADRHPQVAEEGPMGGAWGRSEPSCSAESGHSRRRLPNEASSPDQTLSASRRFATEACVEGFL